MENLAYYLPLLLCPLMLVMLFFFMKRMSDGNNSNKSEPNGKDLQKNMNHLMEQNQKLMKEIDSLKRSQ
ncbi:hypothetical protein BpOF4_20314 (plasmid) [Alkalihalophilus pseudofirmus OF4]|uniref:DUF2933 domain-containing protein n=5 Tax=Bacillaceae TaxID=186817 RepID=D3G134_ALKPO|nr:MULTISPECIES: hypothetical protein [Bacillaceae]ADC52060.1 hypothetical protein BpOF4_20314 [Alkalihalophilus pseudofirmus OF4]KGA97966.1 hypothetical protein BALCAV_0207355 [Alkalihalobacillus alcalophilus ATCC 27647 = CGMCC 1.3604]KHF37887.1 hypothetical protein LQ50_24785 [Halalkalibacter okhensis]MCM3763072.1 hypothetical protein [Halalkalibacter oceani]MED1562743.1 hypothetical protein [Alkalihalobacillus alcalophilus]